MACVKSSECAICIGIITKCYSFADTKWMPLSNKSDGEEEFFGFETIYTGWVVFLQISLKNTVYFPFSVYSGTSLTFIKQCLNDPH